MKSIHLPASAGVFILVTMLTACVGPPDGVRPVDSFDVDRYMGKWYEIARLDHRFERGLSNVSATYERSEDGRIRVINRGYDEKTGEWEAVEGKASFVGDPGTGSLKVSFFGPFYGGYHVLALDGQGYGHAMVSGPNRSYLWILAREKTLPGSILDPLLKQARDLGFSVDELIFVPHDRKPDE
jgi:apolipoprotein D and lipocalin family protein